MEYAIRLTTDKKLWIVKSKDISYFKKVNKGNILSITEYYEKPR